MAKTPFSRSKLADYIAGELNKGTSAEELAQVIASYLSTHNKTSELNSLMRDVMEARAQQNGLVELKASSAFPLTLEQKADIEQTVKNVYTNAKKLIIHHDKDAGSIGGINISLPHSQLDLSVQTKLNRLRSAIAK